jgi:hypothetical protein
MALKIHDLKLGASITFEPLPLDETEKGETEMPISGPVLPKRFEKPSIFPDLRPTGSLVDNLKPPRLELIKVQAGIRIYLVDAIQAGVIDSRWIYERKDARHVVGSHHWGHHPEQPESYIPMDEIWISNKTVKGTDRSRVIWHELYERDLCIQGFDVDEAHVLTKKKENQVFGQ